MRRRDDAYRQGAVWGWLIEPFVSAYLRVHLNVDTACSFLTSLRNKNSGGIGIPGGMRIPAEPLI